MLIDFIEFGSGCGLDAPASEQSFHWLIDRNTKKGDFYTVSTGLGAQLHSFRWVRPKVGESVLIQGVTFRPLHYRRSVFRVMIDWSMYIPEGVSHIDYITAFRRHVIEGNNTDFKYQGR